MRLVLLVPLAGLLACASAEDSGDGGIDAAATARRDANVDAFVVPAEIPSVEDYCRAPVECEDGDPCTIDVCVPVSTVRFEGTCSRTRIEGCVTPPDAGAPDAGVQRDAGPGGPDTPVDPMCSGASDLVPVFLPYVPLGAPDVALGCERGIEWQNCAGSIALRANRVGGARARTLIVDVATYTAPDRLRIHGIDASGASYVLLDTCRVRTADFGDPTDGRSRPPDTTIRRFEVSVREGTRALTLDATAAPSPWYMRVLGLCDLDVDVVSSECTSAERDCVP